MIRYGALMCALLCAINGYFAMVAFYLTIAILEAIMVHLRERE